MIMFCANLNQTDQVCLTLDLYPHNDNVLHTERDFSKILFSGSEDLKRVFLPKPQNMIFTVNILSLYVYVKSIECT